MLHLEFDSIGLKDIEEVKLMNRYDLKYWLHIEELKYLFAQIKEDYYMLNINDEQILPYTTIYYDTLDSQMYERHHNGKKNRYKIRRRSYVNSNLNFLELKFKNNKGKTLKKRIQTNNPLLSLNETEKSFITQNTPYSPEHLCVSLYNEFYRITLVNKNFEERCTIDLNLKFRCNHQGINLSNMVVIEIKSDRGASPSKLKLALRNMRLKPKGFSKYCIGSALTSDKKQNNFKQQIRTLRKNFIIENVELKSPIAI
jgi:hypothetical protein